MCSGATSAWAVSKSPLLPTHNFSQTFSTTESSSTDSPTSTNLTTASSKTNKMHVLPSFLTNILTAAYYLKEKKDKKYFLGEHMLLDCCFYWSEVPGTGWSA